MADENLESLPLNCPRCGKSMRYLRARSADGQALPDDAATLSSIYIYECAEHGRFRFSRDIPLRLDE